jgi:hypothetical protein
LIRHDVSNSVTRWTAPVDARRARSILRVDRDAASGGLDRLDRRVDELVLHLVGLGAEELQIGQLLLRERGRRLLEIGQIGVDASL